MCGVYGCLVLIGFGCCCLGCSIVGSVLNRIICSYVNVIMWLLVV